jgi:hypothetical protein
MLKRIIWKYGLVVFTETGNILTNLIRYLKHGDIISIFLKTGKPRTPVLRWPSKTDKHLT